MKRLFRIASLVIAVAIVGAWLALGTNTGWTMNKVATRQMDEITGIEQVTWTEKWVPGLDFLAVGLACSGILLIASLPRRSKKPQTPVT